MIKWSGLLLTISSLYSWHQTNRAVWSSFRGLKGRVTKQINVELNRNFIVEEIHKTLMQMRPTKASGSDDMSPLFFQQHLPIIRQCITKAMLSALHTSEISSEINHTFITLIPKKNQHTRVANFQPISLCNVLYKLISKVIVNRLWAMMPNIISDSQSAFVPNHQIMNKVLVVYELIYYLRQKRGGKQGFMLLELDMSKTYDCVEWAYLERVMFTLDFMPNMIKLMMNCVKTATFSILINGFPKGFIKPSRELRQGDRLSLYIFSCALNVWLSCYRE